MVGRQLSMARRARKWKVDSEHHRVLFPSSISYSEVWPRMNRTNSMGSRQARWEDSLQDVSLQSLLGIHNCEGRWSRLCSLIPDVVYVFVRIHGGSHELESEKQ